MNDPTDRELPSSPHDAAARDEARISAEMARPQAGTDPFAAAVRATRMPMIVTSPRLPDNPVVFVNNAFCRLTGYAREEILGRNCRFLQGPETEPDTVARIRAAVAATEPIEIDIRNYRKDGVPFWNRLLLAPVRDAEGELAYFFASQVDVTIERERLAGLENHNAALSAELAGRLHAQQEVEARLRFAAQAGRLGIWELDLVTGELTASNVCKEIYGRDPAQPFSYEALCGLVHPDDRDRMARAIKRSVEDGVDYDMEYRIQAGAALRWIHVRAQVVRSGRGQPLRMAGISLDITERRQAEMRLELSEESLRLATEAAEVGTWDLDLVAKTLGWSERTKVMCGIPPAAAGTMDDLYGALHPKDFDAVRAAFGAATDPARRAPFDVEFRTVGRTDGVVRWVAVKGKALFDTSGCCVRALGTAIDITRRKAIDERLLASEADLAGTVATLDALIANAPIGFAFYDRAHRYVRLNGFVAGMNGIALEAHLGRTVEDLQPAHAAVIGEAIDTVVASGRAVTEVEIDERIDDGRRHPRSWLTSFFPVYSSARVIDYVGMTAIEITRRRRAEAAVTDRNTALEGEVAETTADRDRTWNNSRDLLLVMDSGGTLRAVNPAWTAVLGWSPEDVVGQPLIAFVHPDDRRDGSQTLGGDTGDGVPKHESRYVHKDGTARWIEWVASPEGDLIYASGRHVTAEKKAAAELEMAQEQLRQAQKMEAVGQLTGGVAHDFNNLLQVVVGNIEMLQRNLPGDAARLHRAADNAMAGARRAATLTQRLLAFSRRQPLAPKPIDVNALIAGMSDLLNRALGETIVLHTVFAPDLWMTEADPNQLESAILNLAVNARDAMPAGGRLTIETANARLDAGYVQNHADVREGAYVVIAVADGGEGMDRATLVRVFEPFFTTKDVGKGTGLGLAMVYGFVKQSGGHVNMHSAVGQGTTAKIYLPRLVGPAVRDEAPDDVAAPAGSADETVLIVEDSDAVRAYSVEVVRELGYRVLEAAEAAGAMELLRGPEGAGISLLFTDVVLPGGVTGADLAQQAVAIRPALKVLYTTGYARDALVRDGRLDEGLRLITKPFTYAQLAAKIRAVLDEPRR